MLLLSLLPVLYASTTNAANPRLLPRADDVCLHQEDFREKVIQGDLAKASDFWASVGAQKVLSDYLDSHGVANWANDFLGSGYDCGSFPASNNCRSPEKASCSKYDPNAKYYLQISMSNLYNGFIRWHEALQDAAIQEVTSGIKGITDDWGPPKPSSVDVLGLILGASMAVTGFTDEAVEFPVEASMEIFQSVMEASKEAAAQDPADLEGDLEKSLGECFALMKSKLETAVQEIYLANSVGDQLASGLTGIFGHMLNPKEKILRIFNNGVWLDADIVNKAMDEWIKSMVQLIHDGLVVEAWKATTADQGYKKTILHRQSEEIDEAGCRALPLSIWDDEGCKGFATYGNLDTINNIVTYNFWNNDELEKAKKSIRDPGLALKNAVECKKNGGGDPTYPPPDFKALNSDYPACFVNIDADW